MLDTAIQYVEALGEKVRGFNEARIKERVEIIGPRIEVADLRRAISTRCIERLARTWDVMVQQLLRFKKRFGHMNVPRAAKPPRKDLGEWIWNTRADKRNGVLSSDRVAELDALGFSWQVDGQTIEDTNGLLNETEFAKAANLSQIIRYRQQGLIQPAGWFPTSGGLSAFYQSHQMIELKKKLGITLEDISGLLNEYQFGRASGLWQIAQYRQQGLIKPIGQYIKNSGLCNFYHPRQIKELKTKLGITLKDTKGLLNETEFTKACGFAISTTIVKFRKQGLIKPVGWAITSGGLSAFYHPRQARELKKKLGITLEHSTGLLNEHQFAIVSGFSRTPEYRQQGLIKPVGWALAGPSISAHYHPRQAKELKKKLGITLDNTKGLLSEWQFAKAAGFSRIANCRKQGLIKPVGWALAGHSISAHYHPRQIQELKKRLGITLESTKGLLSETKFAGAFGLASCTTISKYRKQGLIKPAGWAIAGHGISAHYHPKQAKELRKKLGVTLVNIKGLLNETEFSRACGFCGNWTAWKCRKQKLITPVGWAISKAGLSPFYHPRQIKELRKKLAELRGMKARKA